MISTASPSRILIFSGIRQTLRFKLRQVQSRGGSVNAGHRGTHQALPEPLALSASASTIHMMKGLVLAVWLGCALIPSTHGKFMRVQTDQVPIQRLFTNLEARVARDKDDL